MTKDVATLDRWPDLPLEAWKDTYATLHMWTQMVGKTCLALAPPQNHWWHIALRVTARGLATGPMLYGSRTLDAEFDFIEHELVLRTGEGAVQKIALRPQSVAEFYRAYLAALKKLDVHVKLWPVPVEVEQPIRFTADETHASYDPEYANRHWRILVQADDVLRRFRAAFYAYAAPEPAGLRDLVPQPSSVYYHPPMGIFILPYAAVRTATSPVDALLAFLQSTYDAAADLAHWDREALERPATSGAPPPVAPTRR